MPYLRGNRQFASSKGPPCRNYSCDKKTEYPNPGKTEARIEYPTLFISIDKSVPETKARKTSFKNQIQIGEGSPTYNSNMEV